MPWYEQRRQPTNPDGNLNFRPFKWNDKTHMLAPCPSPTADRELKDCVLRNALTTTRAADSKWQDETDALANHFNAKWIFQEAEGKTAAMENLLGPVHQCEFMGILDGDCGNINLPTNLNPNFCQNARHAGFNVTVIDTTPKYVITK